jgi:hypothetical protein
MRDPDLVRQLHRQTPQRVEMQPRRTRVRDLDLRAASLSAIQLETLEHHHWMTLRLGLPVLLSEAQMHKIKTRYHHHGRARMAG